MFFRCSIFPPLVCRRPRHGPRAHPRVERGTAHVSVQFFFFSFLLLFLLWLLLVLLLSLSLVFFLLLMLVVLSRLLVFLPVWLWSLVLGKLGKQFDQTLPGRHW